MIDLSHRKTQGVTFMPYYIGADLGGTNIKVGVTDENGKIISKISRATESSRGSEAVIFDIAEMIFEAAHLCNIPMSEVASVGLGCPGTTNSACGRIDFSNNLGWRNVCIADAVHRLVGKDIFIDNDANAAAFGEYIAGSLKGYDNAVLLTLGTGVGSGIIIDGKIFSGGNGFGGEVGHMVICHNGKSCTCGRKGCLEAYASAPALISQTKKKMLEKSDSIMWDICRNDIEKVDAVTPFAAKKAGDRAACEVVRQYASYLANGIVSIVNIFQPDVIALGGGVSGSADEIIPIINGILSDEAFARHSCPPPEVRIASLGNDAGITGAAMLWKSH